MAISRRRLVVGAAAAAVLAAGGGYALVEEEVVPGKYKLDRFLGACDVGGHIPPTAPVPVQSGAFQSHYRKREVGWSVAAPVTNNVLPEKMPLVLALHGAGGDHDWPFTHLGLAHFLADATHANSGGSKALAIASVDGGNTAWHKRADGDDPASMIVFELLPLLASKGFAIDRIALWGWSYGGYGVLLLAEQLGPAHVAAVASTSAAIYPSYKASVRGTFDTQADYDAHDVYAMRSKLNGIPLMMDVGSDDPLHKGVTHFRNGMVVTPDGGVHDGCHDEAFWIKHAADELTFLSRFI